MAISESVRRRLGYQFPPLGQRAFELFWNFMPQSAHIELWPQVRCELDFQDPMNRTLYWKGKRYEYPTIPILGSWMKAGATHFFDIGCNIGFYSFYISSHHPHVKVTAWDPNADVFNRFSRAIRANDLANIEAQNAALGNEEGEARLVAGFNDSGPGTLTAVEGHHSRRGQFAFPVRVMTFDGWVAKSGTKLPVHSAVAKIDVEGYELRVLEGMTLALRERRIRGLVIEVRRDTLARANTSPEEIRQFLAEHHYFSMPKIGVSVGRWRTDNQFFVPEESLD